MPPFPHQSGPAVCLTVFTLDPDLESTPAEESLRALARVQTWIFSGAELFVEKVSRGVRQQKLYTHAYAVLVLLETSKLIASVRQLAQY